MGSIYPAFIHSEPLPQLQTAPIAPPPNPMQQYGQMLGIQGMQQEQQARAQQMQTGAINQQGAQLNLQQQQQQQQDQQAFRAAMQAPKNQGKTISDIADSLADQGGISPQGWVAMKKADLDQRTALAGLDKTQLANAASAHQQTQQLYSNAMDMPDEDLATNWSQIAQQYDNIPGNMKMPLNPQQPMTKQQLQQFGPMLSMHAAYLDQALSRQKAQGDATLHAPMSPDQIGQLNQGFGQRWNVLNAGQPVPTPFQMGPGATPDDFARTDKLMEGTENAQATAAQRAATNGLRQQMVEIAGQKAASQGTQGIGVTLPDGSENPVIDMIGRGQMSATGLLRYMRPQNLPILQAVSEKYPGFDLQRVDAYAKAYGDFTSTKTNSAGGALLAGSTALKHLAELREMNTNESHFPGTPDWNAYRNKADTVATELARFYGDPTVPAIEKLESTLTATLPRNREAAILTQGQSMGDRMDGYAQSWKNAAPSSAYEAEMPGIDGAAKKAWASLDPKYDTRVFVGLGGGQGVGGTPQPGAGPSNAGGGPAVGATRTWPNGKTGKWNGTGWVAQ